MPAIPAAPASRQDVAFSSLTPPRASTGILDLHASRRISRPAGRVSGWSLFSNTGAKTAKSAPSDAARRTSAWVWQEQAIDGLRATSCELRANASAHIERTSVTEI